MAKRVVITGASGFIGRHVIAPLIAEGLEPHLFVRDAEAGRRLAAEHGGAARAWAVDLMDPGAVTKTLAEIAPQTLIHLAWHDGAASRWTTPANLDWMTATLSLARSFARSGGIRMVTCGSCAEYDWTQSRLSETNTPLRPRTLYGAAKAGLFLALDLAQEGLGLSTAWGRVFFVYGPGEGRGRLVRDVIDGLAAGQPVECTDGSQQRDYLHAADVGRAFAVLAKSDLAGAVNIASGDAIPVRTLISEVARQMGRPDLIRLGARPRPADDPPRLAADVGRLHNELGFAPGFDLERGVADTIKATLAMTEAG